MKTKPLNELNSLWENANSISQPVEIQKPLELAVKAANLFASGRCFFFTMDFVITDIDFVSNNTEEISGIPNHKFNLATWLEKWHSEDYEIVTKKESCKANFLFNFIDPVEIINYKVCQKYRMRQKDGTYRLFLNQISTILVTEDFKIQKTLLVQTDITHLGFTMNDRVSFIHVEGGKSYYSDDLETFVEEGSETVIFSKREVEILSLTAQGKTAQEISEILFIAKNTVDTHRRNILGKTNCLNMIEVVSESIRKGWI